MYEGDKINEKSKNKSNDYGIISNYDIISDYPIERMMRDAKITEIYEGTSEVMKMVVSSWMGVK